MDGSVKQATTRSSNRRPARDPMPISEIERHRAVRTLRDYCRRKTNPAVKDQVEVVYRVEGNYAYVSERRPDWRNPTVRRDQDIAKIRFVVKDRVWVLYWRDRNLRWHALEGCPPSRAIGDLLPVVDEHPIFYG